MPAANDPENQGLLRRQRDCRRVEQALLTHPAIADCAVLERARGDGHVELLAYIVPASTVAVEELLARLEPISSPRPTQFVPVSSIPLTPDGRVDAPRLSRLPVLDARLLEEWEASARSVNGIERAAVVVDGSSRRSLPLHLSDVLPGWTLRQASSADVDAAKPAIARACDTARSERPAVIDADSLETDDRAPITLGAALDRAAATSQHGLTFIEADGTSHVESYAALLARALCILGGLQAAGVAPFDRVVLQLERHQDFIEAFWACVLGGFIPVPLAVPSSYDRLSPPLQSLQAGWPVLGKPHIVTVRGAVADLNAAARLFRLDGARVHAVEDLCAEVAGRRHQSDPDDLALLMLTSGSTGTPKAVMLTHRNVLSRTMGSRQLNGFSDRDVTLNWMPLDHVAGLIYFHLRDVYLGCRQIHVPTASILQDPLKWIDYLDEFRATTTFAPNFAFALVNDRGQELSDRSWDLSCVRYVLNGAEAIVARTARRFLTLLGPFGLSARSMHPAWGMSETSSGVIYGDRFSLENSSDDDRFVEVGRPIPGLSIRIVDADDRVVREGSVGCLQVRGPVVTQGYFGSPELTRESFTGDGWFRTGDLGTIRDGRLTITGREKDVVIINSVNYYCHAIESIVDDIDGVETSLTAACAVRPPGTNTDRLAIFFHASDPQLVPDLLARIRADVVARVGIAPDYLLPVDAEAIPKTSLGKIQRSELSRRFLAGDFDAILKQVDRLTANASTIPDWFYRKTWRRKNAVPDDALLSDGATAVIFMDKAGLGAEVRTRLEGRGVRCFAVHAADAFTAGEDGYRIDPHAKSHYDRLLAALSDAGSTPSHIVHLWGYGPYVGEAIGEAIEAAQFEGALSALWLARALSRSRQDAPQTWMTFVASHTQSVNPNETVAYEKSPVQGLLKSMAQEIPWLRCRHVDVYASDSSAAASLIVHELLVPQLDREVAYRRGQRFVAGLERVAFEPGAEEWPPFEQGGTYLVTGGVGGIGEHVAALLAERFHANLLLIGRGGLDARRQEIIDRLGRHGGLIAYESVDVCDERRLTAVVHEYTARVGRSIDGAIHLAGIYYESLAPEDSADRFLAMLRPKTIGTDVLHRLLAAQSGGFVIASSSIAGFFGGASIGAYAAANSFQDAFSAHARAASSVAHYCFSWSNWDDVGQSRQYQLKDAPRVRGYQTIAPTQGLQSLLIGLRFGQRRLLVGLDAAHRHIRRSLVDEPDLLDKPIVYYTTSSGGRPEAALRAVEVRDRFGISSPAELARIHLMPLTGAGEIDKDQLVRLGRGRDANSPAVQPRTETERRLADIWKRVLRVTMVSRDDNFFELGGDSLLAARLVAHLREGWGGEISLRAIFDAPTLSELARLLEQAPSAVPAPGQMASNALTRPLSPGQRALWILHQMAPSSGAYNIAFTARIVSPVNLPALQQSFQALVDRHESLRTIFAAERGDPVQRVQAAVQTVLDVEDASGWRQERLYDQISQDIKRPFDLATGPLVRVRLYAGMEGGACLAATFHHIVMDGWSLWICLSELRDLYRSAVRNDPPTLPPTEGQSIADFLRWQTEMPASPEGARHLDYWTRHVGDTVPVLNLPTDRPRPPLPAYHGASQRFRLGIETTERLKRLAWGGRATPQMAMLALFQVLLQRYTGQEDLMVGYLSSGRSRAERESIVGYLANLLPLRLGGPSTSTFRDALKRTRDRLLEALDHQDYPFLPLVDRLAADRDVSRSPLFQVLFVYEKPQLLEAEVAPFVAGIPGARMTLGDLELESLPFPIQQEGQFDLTLMVVEVGGQLCFTIDYNTDLFDASTVRRMGNHLLTLADAAAVGPDRAVGSLPMVTDDERRQLRSWNGVRADHGEGCIHQMFERQAAEHPEAIALVAGAARLTYAELNARANQLARYLRELGVGPNTPVGILVERSSLDLVVGMLGILKAGGAFLPLDQAQPAERLKFMFLDSGAPLLVTQSALIDRMPACGGRLVTLDREAREIEKLEADDLGVTATAGDLAYIIYTSGSTGHPKGVLLEHRGLWNVAREQQRLFRPGPGSRVLQFASVSFDAAVFDLAMALGSGASLHLVPRDAILPGLPLLETLRTEAINILTIPPSALANLPLDPLPALRLLLVAGEACPPELVSRWAHGRRFFNLYGPTEATIWATYAECVDGDQRPPIGSPVANTQAYVLDANLNEVPVGVPGELYLGGPGLARGYLNQLELTERSFMRNPWQPESGDRLYRTGDLVRRDEDGLLHYLGRADAQVKLRGFRIELGEIEAALGRHRDVRQAVVLLREDTPGDRRLVAYVASHRLQPTSAAALKRHLQTQLPDYMVPSAVVFVEAFPVTVSGKVDRLALRAPDALRHVEETFEPPAGEMEERIAGVWRELLNVDPIGADDNFFDIGGNSLLVARVHARLNEWAPSPLSIVDLFQYPTIRALAARLACAPLDVNLVNTSPTTVVAAGQARLLDQARRRRQASANQTVE